LGDTGIPTSQRWRRSPDLAVVDHGERVVVLAQSEPATARPLVLEGPAVTIWRALDEPGTTSEVVARVAADSGFPAAEVRRDVEAFLERLDVIGLVLMERVPRSDPDGDNSGRS
jgi:hypothetical protein